jgi:hypothetical protein
MEERMPHRRDTREVLRKISMAALAVAVVMAATLGPQALVGPLRYDAFRAVDALIRPFSLWVPWNDLERIMNVMLFIPVGAGLAAVLGRGLGRTLTAASVGVALSIAVEAAQESIPGRVPDGEDIVWNGLGVLVGVLAVVAVRTLRGAGCSSRAGARGRRRATYVVPEFAAPIGARVPGSRTSTASPPSDRATTSSVPW